MKLINSVNLWSLGRSGSIHSEKNFLVADYRKDCKQEDQRDGLVAKAEPNHPASPIGKNIPNREANDAKGSIQKRDLLARSFRLAGAQFSTRKLCQSKTGSRALKFGKSFSSSGPVAALYAPFRGSHPTVRHTNVLTYCSSSDSALLRREESEVRPVMSH